MRGRLLPHILLLGAVLPVESAPAQSSRLPTDVWSDADRSLLGTSCVVRATLRATDPVVLIRAAERGGSYVRLRLEVHEALSGLDPEDDHPKHLTFFAAPENHAHGFRPSAYDMRSHLGRERLLLLQRIGDRYFLTDRFRGTSIFATEHEAALRRLAAEHNTSRTTPLPEDLPRKAEIAALLDRLTRPRKRDAQAAWTTLQGLPTSAIPALVEHLEDERELPETEFLLRRGTQRDLTISAHRPPTVGHAALLLLRHISGESIGPRDAESADAEQLAQSAACWRVVAHRLLRRAGNGSRDR